MGSAVNDAVSELGGSFGVAILGGILAFFYRARIDEAVSSAGPVATELPDSVLETVRESLASAMVLIGQLPQGLGDPARSVVSQAFVSGMGWALTTGAVVTFLGALLAWRYFPRRMDKVEE